MDLRKGVPKLNFRGGFPRVDPKERKGRGKSHEQEVYLADNKEILPETKFPYRKGMKNQAVASKAGLEELEV